MILFRLETNNFNDFFFVILAIQMCLLKYVRFRNIKQLEKEKLEELVEMIQEYLSVKTGDINDKLISPTSLSVHHERLPLPQQSKVEEKSTKLYTSSEELNSRSAT